MGSLLSGGGGVATFRGEGGSLLSGFISGHNFLTLLSEFYGYINI